MVDCASKEYDGFNNNNAFVRKKKDNNLRIE